MGMIEPMVIVGAMSRATLSLPAPHMWWAMVIALLAATAAGILFAIPRPRRTTRSLRLVRPATAH